MDLISRQAAIAVADSSDYVGLSVDDVKKVTDEVVKGLKQLPSAQPEIIRCEDCKHYEADIMGNPWGVCCHKDWVIDNCGSLVYEKGWCYRAERRTDDC